MLNQHVKGIFKILKETSWLIVLLLFVHFYGLSAANVSLEQVKQMVLSFQNRQPKILNPNEFTIGSIEYQNLIDNKEGIYVVHLEPQGFVLVTNSTSLPPILAFSNSNPFVGLAVTKDLLRTIVKNWEKIVKRNSQWYKFNQEQWALSTVFQFPKTNVDTTYYFPTPIWGQGSTNGVYIFNYYTPNHWSAGCVATAMAEVLAYYRWPPVGTSSHCYTENDAGQLCADYASTYYDWPNTLFKYEGVPTTTAQRQAAGLLTLHTAISVNMDFSANGSTANVSNAPAAFHNYFRLSGHYKSSNTSGFWDEMINNMKDERPVILAIHRSDGLGHAVVVDGYSELNGLFHLNMGWNGNDNGWYDIAGTWNAGGYNSVDGASKGLIPNPMILSNVEQLSDTTFILRWRVSPKLKAQYFELQQARSSSGPWETLNSTIFDTLYVVQVPTIGNYYYRVRARRDDIWWDWSAVQKISLGGPRYLTFNVNMTYQTLAETDSVVLRGNLPPLQGSINSRALQDTAGTGIYSITLPFDIDYAGKQLLYRFAIARSNGTQLESFNRSYVIGYAQYQNLDTVYFDDYTFLEDSPTIAQKIGVLGNYPNPFNPCTTIFYSLSKAGHVRLEIYNVAGEKICLLIDELQTPGKHVLKFNGQNLAAGIYWYHLHVDQDSKVGKMVLLK